jgi:phage RecT family recombinase
MTIEGNVLTETAQKTFKSELQKNLTLSVILKNLLANNSRIGYEEFCAKVMGTVMSSDTLRSCSVASIMQCCLKSAQIGLPVDASGYAYLVPRGKEATYQIGSKGYIELMKRNKNVQSVLAETVYEKDVFEYYIDETGKHIKHTPNLDIETRENEKGFKAVYAIITYDNGGSEIEVMSKTTIDKIKGVATSKNIWNMWYGEKAKTAVIKRLGKRAALMNVSEAIEIDESDDYNNTLNSEKKAIAGLDDLVFGTLNDAKTLNNDNETLS